MLSLSLVLGVKVINGEKMNEEQTDGYFWCSCRNIEGGGGGLTYLPLEVSEKRKQNKLFLDEEELKETEIKKNQK